MSRPPRGQGRPEGWRQKAKPKRTPRLPPGRARLRGGAARWARDGGCGERKRQRCHRRGPFVTVTLPSPASTASPQPPHTTLPQAGAGKSFAKSGRPAAAEPLGGARPVPAHLRSPSPRSPQPPRARSLARSLARPRLPPPPDKQVGVRTREARVSRRRKSTVAPSSPWGEGRAPLPPQARKVTGFPADKPGPRARSRARPPGPGAAPPGLRRLVPPT